MIPLYACAAALALSGALGFGLYKSVQRNGALSEQLTTVEQERDDARDKAVLAAKTTREHAEELARLRKQNGRGSSTVRAQADDGCADRDMPPALGDVLRMREPPDKGNSPPAG